LPCHPRSFHDGVETGHHGTTAASTATGCAGISPVRNRAWPQVRADHGARWYHRVGVSGRRTGAAIGLTVCARGRNTHAARFTIEVVLASSPVRGPGPVCAALCIGHPGDRGRTFRVPDLGRPQFGTQGGVMTDQSAPGELIWQDGVITTCQSGAPPALSQI